MSPSQHKDRLPVIDQAKAKLVAYGVVAVMIGVMAVLGVRSVSGPQLYEGDRLESRTCRVCDGAGTQQGEKCRGCLGAKRVKVIVPGPEHPVEIRGTVRDLAVFPDLESAQAKAAQDASSQEVSLKPVEGAVRNARLEFKSDWGQINVESKATGKFRCRLKPGDYRVTITAEGFPEETRELTVPARQLPVWPKNPGLSHKDEEQIQVDLFLGS